MAGFFSVARGRRVDTTLLDIHNALVHWRDSTSWKALEQTGVRTYKWDSADSLADMFLMQFGGYPEPAEIGIDYVQILADATLAIDERFANDQPIPAKALDHPSISYLSRHQVERHHSLRSGSDTSGFSWVTRIAYTDLTLYWNLRAADIRLQFIDPAHIERFEEVVPYFQQCLLAEFPHRPERDRRIAVWSGRERLDEAAKLFPEQPVISYGVDKVSWNGLNLRPPMMTIGQETSLGVLGRGQTPRVTFAFSNKPFCDDSWFLNQHLVASISISGGLYGDDQHTFRPVYVPEANGFFGRTMRSDSRKFRIEPERLGVIIKATDHDAYLNALPVGKLFEQIFDQAGVRSSLSSGGLITRQLLARLGGADGARVFKIPGVRRLLRTYGPTASFTKKSAHQLIGQKDPHRTDAKFSDHKNLYIEPRPNGGDLTPQMVFGYLVEKGLLRIGSQLMCPSCRVGELGSA